MKTTLKSYFFFKITHYNMAEINSSDRDFEEKKWLMVKYFQSVFLSLVCTCRAAVNSEALLDYPVQEVTDV